MLPLATSYGRRHPAVFGLNRKALHAALSRLFYYFDLYWDLHLGVKGNAIPPGVRQIGKSFNCGSSYSAGDATCGRR